LRPRPISILKKIVLLGIGHFTIIGWVSGLRFNEGFGDCEEDLQGDALGVKERQNLGCRRVGHQVEM
jgi:hypothetical protein